MKKPEVREVDPVAGAPFADPTWAKGLPRICEYLSTTAWDDGTPREPSTLTIKAQDGQILCALNDKDASRTLYATADTVMGGLKSLEKHLEANTGDWRAWQAVPRGRRK